jgi:hypothetical protein
MYAIVLYNEVARNEQNRPLTHDGKIVFFKEVSQAQQVLALGDRAFRKYRVAKHDIAATYDVVRVMDLIVGGEYDKEALLADFINELLDFVAATKWTLSGIHRDALFALADTATFDKGFGEMLRAHPEKRKEACDALLWCFGAILSSSIVAP